MELKVNITEYTCISCLHIVQIIDRLIQNKQNLYKRKLLAWYELHNNRLYNSILSPCNWVDTSLIYMEYETRV